MDEQDQDTECYYDPPGCGPDLPLNRDKITIDFPNSSAWTVLRDVFNLYQINVTIPDELKSVSVSLKLKEVDWVSILDIILEPTDYEWFVENRVIRIVPKDEDGPPRYTEITVRMMGVSVSEVEAILQLFPNRDDGESAAIIPKWNHACFRIRTDRLRSLRIFVKNIEADRGTQPGATDNPDDAQRLREDN